MKTNLKRLELVEVELFYVVTIRQSGIELQGEISNKLIKYCVNELNIKLETTKEGWLRGETTTIELGNITITLT
jgi:hypothetical protein